MPKPTFLVQLPFPSQGDPDATLAAYYEVHAQLFRQLVPNYHVGEGDLWEAPLWVAHIDGAIGRGDTQLLDLSRSSAEIEACVAAIEKETAASCHVFLSPLAQNFDLAVGIARAFRGSERVVVLGGNMARLASPADFDVVYRGQATSNLSMQIEQQASGVVGTWPKLGPSQSPPGFRPRYRLLRQFGRRVPLVRVNASHGCLFACTFCGDGWSRQLHVVPYADLVEELAELAEAFPNIRCLYIGDKTFGQSREAVENLIRACADWRRSREIIVQTHVRVIDDWLLGALDRLGVRIVELGMETADPSVLRQVKKSGGPEQYRNAIDLLSKNGNAVILNVLGGLPYQTEASHEATLGFLHDTAGLVHSYNLYNFVPYPETPLFDTLKPRIRDWRYANWREDRPVVFEPYVLSRERLWQQFLEVITTCTRMGEQRLNRLQSRSQMT